MTTIVYDHKNRLIACDGRQTSANGHIRTELCKKWASTDAGLYFMCGTVADFDVFLSEKKERGHKPSISLDITAFTVKSDGVYICAYCEDTGFWEERLTFNRAIGSGSDYALAALDFNLSALDAVLYASSRDAYTGSTVSVFDVLTGDFKIFLGEEMK